MVEINVTFVQCCVNERVEVGEEEVQSICLHQHHVSKSALSLYEHLFSMTLTQWLSYSTSSEAYYNCKK